MGRVVKLFDDAEWSQQSNQDRLRRTSPRGANRLDERHPRKTANSEQKRSRDAVKTDLDKGIEDESSQ
jgi:hypothetical protein